MCDKTFSVTKGGLFYRLRTPPVTVMLVIALLTYGYPPKAAALALDLDERTVRDWWKRAGKQSEAVHEHLVVSQPGSVNIDIDVVIENTHAQVEKSLPGAYLTFLSVVAQCSDLEAFRGEINLDFTQVRRSFFGERVTVARAGVDTLQQTLSLEIRDETDYYPATEPLVLQGLNLETITSNLVTYLRSIEQCGGTVVLARTNSGSPWRVRCGPPDKVFVECIEIDPTTGGITELR